MPTIPHHCQFIEGANVAMFRQAAKNCHRLGQASPPLRPSIGLPQVQIWRMGESCFASLSYLPRSFTRNIYMEKSCTWGDHGGHSMTRGLLYEVIHPMNQSTVVICLQDLIDKGYCLV